MLNPGEEVVLDVRPHWWYLTAPVVVLVIVIVGSLYAAIAAPSWTDWVALVVLVLAAGWMLRRYVRWTSTRLVVTTSRLIRRTGVLSRTGREIPLAALTDVSFRQTLWGRVIGEGDLLLESAGRDGREVFPDLPHPADIQREIAYQVDQLRRQNAGPPPGARPAAFSISDQIEQLDGLRRRGLITEDEFEAKKIQLLDRL
jgi:membrane protein YdbS with pleckstrin-like domain